MENFSSADITLDVIGHDVNAYMIILKLPSGAIVPATIARANFNKHMIPLFANPPEKIVKEPVQQKQEVLETIQTALQDNKEEKADDLWWDMDAMFQEIRWHAKNNSRSVVLDNRNVQPPRLAFRCDITDTSWSMNIDYMYDILNRLSLSQNKEEQARAFQIRKCLGTSDGKKRLVDSLNSAIQ